MKEKIQRIPISIDIEADGPIPGDFSMVSFGAVVVERELNRTFYAEVKPISDVWIPEALAVGGFTREQVMKFDEALFVMKNFDIWVESLGGQPIFYADNNGFDWSFINWYYWHFLNKNPFGWSSRNINDLYHGCKQNVKSSFKHLRDTKHSHNALDDAMSNAEALIKISDKFNLKIV